MMEISAAVVTVLEISRLELLQKLDKTTEKKIVSQVSLKILLIYIVIKIQFKH